LFDALKEAFYWLISAALLAYLTLETLALLIYGDVLREQAAQV
jgi:hypothetical protein